MQKKVFRYILLFIPLLNAINLALYEIKLYKIKHSLNRTEYCVFSIAPLVVLVAIDAPLSVIHKALLKTSISPQLLGFIILYVVLTVTSIGVLLLEKYVHKVIDTRNSK